MATRLPEGVERGTAVEAAGTELADVRPMAPADVDAVVEIERRAFSTPWRAGTFLRLLERDDSELRVATMAGRGVVGYTVLWCVTDQGELANIAVREDVRGRGVGSLLLDDALRLAPRRGVRSLYLEVRESNERALGMYRARGFERAGRRTGYYTGPKEDALVLVKRFDAGPGAGRPEDDA